MDNPTPLRQLRDGAQADIASLVDAARAPEPWPADERAHSLRRLSARAHREARRRATLQVAGAMAAVLALALGTGWAGLGGGEPARLAAAELAPVAAPEPHSPAPGWQLIDSPDLGIVVSAGGRVERYDAERERALHLERGVLRAQIVRQEPSRPVVVTTPHVRVVVVGTQFDVRVDSDRTLVSVLEGKVRVEHGALSVLVGAGETVRSDDPRLIASAPAPRAHAPLALSRRQSRAAPAAAEQTLGDCDRHAPPARFACYERLALGDNLAAENALFALAEHARRIEGAPERGLEYLRLHERRFPSGVLAPEVALKRFEIALESARMDEALGASEEFVRRFAADPRAAEVALARAGLLCRTGRRAAGLELLHALEPGLRPALQETAARLRQLCVGDPPPPPDPDDPGLD